MLLNVDTIPLVKVYVKEWVITSWEGDIKVSLRDQAEKKWNSRSEMRWQYWTCPHHICQDIGQIGHHHHPVNGISRTEWERKGKAYPKYIAPCIFMMVKKWMNLQTGRAHHRAIKCLKYSLHLGERGLWICKVSYKTQANRRPAFRPMLLPCLCGPRWIYEVRVSPQHLQHHSRIPLKEEVSDMYLNSISQLSTYSSRPKFGSQPILSICLSRGLSCFALNIAHYIPKHQQLNGYDSIWDWDLHSQWSQQQLQFQCTRQAPFGSARIRHICA